MKIPWNTQFIIHLVNNTCIFWVATTMRVPLTKSTVSLNFALLQINLYHFPGWTNKEQVWQPLSRLIKNTCLLSEVKQASPLRDIVLKTMYGNSLMLDCQIIIQGWLVGFNQNRVWLTKEKLLFLVVLCAEHNLLILNIMKCKKI